MKYRLIIAIFIIGLLTINGCSPIFNKESFSEIMKVEKGYYSFNFFPDSIFTYKYNGFGNKHSSGIWEKEKNTIILTTFNQKEKFSLTFDKDSIDKNEITINISLIGNENNIKDYICTPYINGKIKLTYPERGNYSFTSEVPIDSISFLVWKNPLIIEGYGTKSYISPMFTETVKVNLSSKETLNAEIEIIDSLFYYKVFKEEKLKIKGNSLIFKEGKKKYKLKRKI